MKRLTILVLLTLSLNAFSQIGKGQWLIGGNAALSFARSKELQMTTIQLSPASGYFFVNKLAGGLRIDFGSETYNWAEEKFRYSIVSFAPFLRYYFLPAEQKVNLFADAAYGFAWGKYKNLTYGSNYTHHYNTLSFIAGPAIFLNEHTALEITLGYTHSTRGSVDSTITNKLQVGVGLQIHFGTRKG